MAYTDYTDLTAGTYIIQFSKGTSYVVDLAGASATDGRNIQLYTSNGSRAQQWKIARTASPNVYSVRSAIDDDYGLDVYQGSMVNGTNIQLYTYSGNVAQTFKLVKDGSDVCFKVVKDDTFLVDVDGGTLANGTNIQIWKNSVGVSTNKFRLLRASYAVKFNANGGSGTMANESFYMDVAKALTANAFTRTGYTTDGWATSSGGSKVYNNKASVTNLATTHGATFNLYAHWVANTYTVKYSANGGSNAPASTSHTYGVSKKLTTSVPTRTGYTFKNWNTKADGSGTSYAGGTNAATVTNLTATNNGTVTLYAQWTAITYSVKYNANGGTGTMANSSHVYGTAKALTANAFTRQGHVFKNWNTASDGSGTSYADKASVKNLRSTAGTANLYAQWMSTYAKPTLTASAFRCDADGNADDEGAYIKITASWSCVSYIDQGNANSATVTYQVGSESAVTVGSTLSGSWTGVVGGAYTPDAQYQVVVTARDEGGYTQKTMRVDPASYIIDVGRQGKSMGLGVAASATVDNLLRVGYLTDFLNVLKTIDANIWTKSTITDMDADSIESEYTRYIGMMDKDNEWISTSRFKQYTSGDTNAALLARVRVNGTVYTNSLQVGMHRDGTSAYYITDKKAFCDALAIGTIVSQDTSSAISMANSAWASVASVTLGPGTWVITGSLVYASNATGRRLIGISNSTSVSGAFQRYTEARTTAISGAQTTLHTSYITTRLTASSTTYHLFGYQTSGGALNVTGALRAVRVSS